ncbi:MAG: NADH-quinone oxidoreductase subunit NuoE [Anaerolineae bacterium]
MDKNIDPQKNTAATLLAVEKMLERHNYKRNELIGVLQDVQETYHYLPEEAMNYIATAMGIPTATVFGVATFYAQFSLEPKGKYLVRICNGTACHVNGSEPIYENLKKKFKLPEGRITTSDGLFTLETVACMGACGIGPVMVIDDQVYARITPEAAVIIIDTLLKRDAEPATVVAEENVP